MSGQILVWKSYGDTGRTALGERGCWRVFTDGEWWHLTFQQFGQGLVIPRGKFVTRRRAQEFAEEREGVVPA